MSLVYRHYGSSQFHAECQPDSNHIDSRNMKPTLGLWASPLMSRNSWYRWCMSEDFRTDTLNKFFDFKLKTSAMIYTIESKSDLVEFLNMYPGKKLQSFEQMIYCPKKDMSSKRLLKCFPDFKTASEDFDGIEVSISKCPDLYYWLYGWDVDSLVVWNYNVVEVA